MAHTLVMRASSLAASALILATALIGAASLKYAVETFAVFDAPPPVFVEPQALPPTPPAPEHLREPPLQPQAEVISPLGPAQHTEAPPQFASLPSFAPPQPVTIENPRWASIPRDLARYYPRRPLLRGVEGIVQLDCLVAVSGHLSCAVVSESPTGWGFGEAAQRLAHDHVMAPATRDGAAVEGRYAMRVPFLVD